MSSLISDTKIDTCGKIQCVRRAIEEKSVMQGLNGLKYLSTVVALIMRTLYDITRQNGKGLTSWRVMAATTSGFTTVYSTYWDIVIDWGLLQKNSTNKWLRDKLLIPNKAVYFVAIVSSITIIAFYFIFLSYPNIPNNPNLVGVILAGVERASKTCLDAVDS